MFDDMSEQIGGVMVEEICDNLVEVIKTTELVTLDRDDA